MFASIIIGFIGYGLALFFAILFAAGALDFGLFAVSRGGRLARMTAADARISLFICGPIAMALAAITRALV